MLRVFEAFAGYGSQRMALKRCHIPHEIVGISEIEGDVILSYASIHENLLEIRQATVMSASFEMMQPCSTAKSGNLFSSVVIFDVFLIVFLPFVVV